MLSVEVNRLCCKQETVRSQFGLCTAVTVVRYAHREGKI